MKKINIIFYSLCCLGVMSCGQDELISLEQLLVRKGLDNRIHLGLDKTKKGAESLKDVPEKSDVKNSFVVPEKATGNDLKGDLAKIPPKGEVQKHELENDLAKIPQKDVKNSLVVPEKATGDDLKGDLAKIPPKGEVQKHELENDLEEVYTKLDGSVAKYKTQLNNERSQFDPNRHSFRVPFSKVNARFDALEQQADIYAALKHDVETIQDLASVLNRLNLQEEFPLSQKNSTISENELANNLLILIWQVGYFTKKIINVHLSSGNLNRIKASKDVDKLVKITDFLKKFIRMRANAVKTIQNQIKLLASKNDKLDLLEAIKVTVGLSGNDGREIQKVGYLIVKLEDDIQLLIN
ncbi:hypothetical protein BOFE_08760 (plasmid) [Candidatus Borrelia fainii]|uniref:Lipoprotein n=1 Tax=Candidatus Borrelia fainii TaxID=2518322 RepID=A0ABM8DL75_9SPIR|nr:hypothetical protein [Candidatus Borrelia fainii]BDU63336.1 hypothetical protein BOFE_08760 [Candidatus Borrelia fainii]